MLQIGEKFISVYFCLIKDFSCDKYYLLWKFTNLMLYLCERIILITPLTFSKLTISAPNATIAHLIKMPTCTSKLPRLGTLWHPKQKSQLVSQITYSLQTTINV